MVQKFPALYVARRFITVLTSGRAACTYPEADERCTCAFHEGIWGTGGIILLVLSHGRLLDIGQLSA